MKNMKMTSERVCFTLENMGEINMSKTCVFIYMVNEWENNMF